jgi:hypothetical protein
VSLPKPLPGLVIRYNYLWASDAADGQDTGDKERPAAIVMAVDIAGTSEVRIFALPITHSKPAASTEAMEIPASVCRAAGLDAARSWVVLSEFNEFIWPGFDLGLVPGRNPRTVAYGFLTSGFFSSLRDRWLELHASRGSASVARDD